MHLHREGLVPLFRLGLLYLINFHLTIRIIPVLVISTPSAMMCSPNTAAQFSRQPVQMPQPKPSQIPHTYAVRHAKKQQSRAEASTNVQI